MLPLMLLQVLDLVVPLFRNVFHGSSLIFMLLYLWSKRNPNAPISILGLLQLQVSAVLSDIIKLLNLKLLGTYCYACT